MNSSEHDNLRLAIWSNDSQVVKRYTSWMTTHNYDVDEFYPSEAHESAVPPSIFQYVGLAQLNYLEEAFLSLYSAWNFQFESGKAISDRLQICVELLNISKPSNRNPLCSPWVLVNHSVARSMKSKIYELMDLALTRGFDVNAVFKVPFLELPKNLLESVTRQHGSIPVDYLKLFLKFGLDLDQSKIDGIPLFKAAAIYGQLDVVRYLLNIERESWQRKLLDSNGHGLIKDALERISSLRYHHLVTEFLNEEIILRSARHDPLQRKQNAMIRDELLPDAEQEPSMQVKARSASLSKRY